MTLNSPPWKGGAGEVEFHGEMFSNIITLFYF